MVSSRYHICIIFHYSTLLLVSNLVTSNVIAVLDGYSWGTGWGKIHLNY